MSSKKTTQDWDKEDIKAAIRKKGISMSELARANGYKSRTFLNVLRMPYPKVQMIVGDFLGVAPEVIWPSRYLKPTQIQPSRYAKSKEYRKAS